MSWFFIVNGTFNWNLALAEKHKKDKPAPSSYRKRKYRSLVDCSGLVSFEVQVRETDLHLLAEKDYSTEVTHLVFDLRNKLENYIAKHPEFLKSLLPVPYDPLAPEIVREMMKASKEAGVGPMASVAGVTSQIVGENLIKEQKQREVVVENGGDIYLRRNQECIIAIFAGNSPLSNNVGIRLKASQMPLGVCTSSASVGHSLSLGQADAVTVLSSSTALADAVATRLGNETKKVDDINAALELGAAIEGVMGIVIIHGDQLGAWGEVELTGL